MLVATVQGNTITGAGPQAQTGQQGVFATGLATGAISGNAITDNLGAGDAASAGVRLVDLDLTPTTVGGTTTKLTATGNTITGNGYGVRNETGAGADQALAFTATGNWWGHVAGPSIGLPKTVGDPVNGAAVTYSGFRTTPIPALHRAERGRRRAPDGRDRPAGGARRQPGTAYTLRALAADDFGVKSVTFAIGGDDHRHRRDGAVQRRLDPGRRARGPDRDADGDGHRLVRPGRGGRRRSRCWSRRRTPRADGHADPHRHADPDARADLVPAATPTATPTPEPITAPAATAPTAVTLKAKPSKGRKLALSGALTLPAGAACPVGAHGAADDRAARRRQADHRQAQGRLHLQRHGQASRPRRRPQGHGQGDLREARRAQRKLSVKR